MNALELFRAGYDTIEIAERLGLPTEAQAFNMLSALRKEEHARSTGAKFVIPTFPAGRVPYAGKDAR